MFTVFLYFLYFYFGYIERYTCLWAKNIYNMVQISLCKVHTENTGDDHNILSCTYNNSANVFVINGHVEMYGCP